ncbi:hypothetical protein G3480_17855 [Thiorhodococcus mannitoliphagus]|uniref:Uncharacterized protein n=1 Tax=Thiorhodococcus mannitoliphagus TaxID=329406 RepID=A0A6P1DUX6_9GAMM|nr:hypothetical protein [Thiorhodococcus mannitoliphagus]NEX22147.1 hypothetical protein [Thiorhodococcus mannitoliphagus]
MPLIIRLRQILLIGSLLAVTASLSLADTVTDVGILLREILQDRPVPRLPYLNRAAPMNPDSGYFKGRYGGIDISVETHPNSDLVAAILLAIPGPNRTREILPAVSAVLGPPHSSDPTHGIYGWEWPDFRTASVHYVAGGGDTAGQTIISIFYR